MSLVSCNKNRLGHAHAKIHTPLHTNAAKHCQGKGLEYAQFWPSIVVHSALLAIISGIFFGPFVG